MALAGALRLEVSELKGKTLETQSLLEKREMEANLATQQQAEAEKQAHMDVSVLVGTHTCRCTCMLSATLAQLYISPYLLYT